MAEAQNQNAEEPMTAYWCYQCEKEVTLEAADMVCSECRNGFVEAAASAQNFRARTRRHQRHAHAHARVSGIIEDDSSQRRQVLNLLTHLARPNRRRNADAENNGSVYLPENRNPDQGNQNDADDDTLWSEEEIRDLEGYVFNLDHQQEHVGLGLPLPLPLPLPGTGEEDFFVEGRDEEEDDGHSVLDIEVDAYSSLEEDEDDNDEEEEEEDEVVIGDDWEEVNQDEVEAHRVEDDDSAAAAAADVDGVPADSDLRQGGGTDFGRVRAATATGGRRRDVLRFRIRDWNSQAAGPSREGSGRALGWSEILRGLEENTLELRLSLPEEEDTYVGNPEDYVDEAGYEVLLQNLAENDDSQRGAPPAAKSVVEALPCLVICKQQVESEAALCAICKDMINEGDIGKQLPCFHLYHGDCILPWLKNRNSCPICRYELPTDDAEYEELRKQRGRMMTRAESANSDSSFSAEVEGLF